MLPAPSRPALTFTLVVSPPRPVIATLRSRLGLRRVALELPREVLVVGALPFLVAVGMLVGVALGVAGVENIHPVMFSLTSWVVLVLSILYCLLRVIARMLAPAG